MSRPVEHPEYIETFPARLQSAFDEYVGKEDIIINASRDLIPLSLLETALGVSENMHVVGFGTRDKIFSVLMDTIKQYTDIHTGGIFDHYYGFLCIRHLIRMVCIGVLTKAGLFEKILDTLDPNIPRIDSLAVWGDMSLFCIRAFLDKHNQANHDSAFPSATLLLDDTVLCPDDAKLLLDLLWEGRGSVILLRGQDVLPGLPTLMLVLLQLIGNTLSYQIKTDWLRIQDISLRCYFGYLQAGNGTDDERYTLERINEFIMRPFNGQMAHILHAYDVWLPIDINDALTIAGMYSVVLSPVYPIKTSLMFYYIIFRWVICLLERPMTRQNATDELVPSVFKTALAVLQAVIDEEAENPMSDNTRTLMRASVHVMVIHINDFVSSEATTHVLDILMKVLVDSDICGIIGRVLVLITREKDEPYNWDPFLQTVYMLGKLLIEHEGFPLTYIDQVRYEWSRLLPHLLHLGWGIIITSHTPKRLLEDARNTWFFLLGNPSKNRVQTVVCAYPRCAYPDSILQSQEIGHICGRCGKAWYCCVRCQLMHWELDTLESRSQGCLLY